jgi:hypothetical protein
MTIPELVVTVTPDSEGRTPADIRGKLLAHMRKYAGATLDIVIRKHRNQRSADQNAFWWSVPVAILSDHCGYEPEQMHYVLLGEWRGYMDGPNGKPVPRCASSSKLTTAEFTDLIEWVQRWAAQELNVQIPAPNEHLPEKVPA